MGDRITTRKNHEGGYTAMYKGQAVGSGSDRREANLSAGNIKHKSQTQKAMDDDSHITALREKIESAHPYGDGKIKRSL